MFYEFVLICQMGAAGPCSPSYPKAGVEDRVACITNVVTTVNGAEYKGHPSYPMFTKRGGKLYFDCVERPANFDWFDDVDEHVAHIVAELRRQENAVAE